MPTIDVPRKPSAVGVYALPLKTQSAIADRLTTHTLKETRAWLGERGIEISKSSLSSFRIGREARKMKWSPTVCVPIPAEGLFVRAVKRGKKMFLDIRPAGESGPLQRAGRRVSRGLQKACK